MKNSKVLKIASLIFAFVLLTGCIFGVVASADSEEATTVEIANKNISYEGAIRILYAIDAQNVKDGQTVKLNVYADAEGTELLYAKALSKETITLNGTTYSIAFSNGIAPMDLRKSVYAKPVVVDAEGNVVAEGEMVTYSVWQYVVNRFSKSYSADQAELYSALLDYAAAVQKTLLGETVPAEGYIDQYYGYKFNLAVNGAVIEEGDEFYFVDKTAACAGVQVMEDPVYEGKYLFDVFTDKDGNRVTPDGCYITRVNPSIGANTYTANYVTSYYLPVTYDAETLAGNFISSENTFTTEKESTANLTVTLEDGSEKTYTITYVKHGLNTLSDGTYCHSRHSRIVRITDADGTEYNAVPEDTNYKVGKTLSNSKKDSKVPAIYNGNDLSQGSAITIKNQSTQLNLTYKSEVYRHVFQTDIKIGSINSTYQGWFLNSDSHKLWGFNIDTNGNGTIKFGIQGDKAEVCPDYGRTLDAGYAIGEWVNLRFEYYDLADDKFEVLVYINGELIANPATENGAWVNHWSNASATKNANDSYVNFYTNMTYGATNIDVYFDNTYMVTEYVDTYKRGDYANEEGVSDFDLTDELAANGHDISKLYDAAYKTEAVLGITPGDYYGYNLTSNYYKRLAVENGNYYFTAAKSTTENKGLSFNKYFKETPLSGDAYVIEFDIRMWGKGAENVLNSSTKDPDLGWIRVYSGSTSNERITVATLADDNGASSGIWAIDEGGKIEKGEWVNVRLVITPNKDKATSVSIDYYFDGVLVKSAKTTSASQFNNQAITRVSFEFRGLNSHYAYDIDNLYIGVAK